MAESVGGQAIALLSMCLVNLFGHPKTGLILSRVCSNLCPRSANVSSVAQLADVATLLAGKIQTLGFGNLLAKEVAKIHGVYSALGRQLAPSMLLKAVASSVVPDILEKVSQALCQENKVCRISGHIGMGYIVGLIQALFPRDHTLIVEGVVIKGVDHPKIRCEIVVDADADLPTRIYLETSIPNTVPIKLPIDCIAFKNNQPISSGRRFLNFSWSNWLADFLHLMFLSRGLACDQNVIEAFSNLLVLAPESILLEDEDGESSPMPLLNLLGPQPLARVCLICRHVLGFTPTEHGENLRQAYDKFLVQVLNISSTLACGCTGKGDISRDVCRWSKGWLSNDWGDAGSKLSCPRYSLWEDINQAINHGLWSIFLDAGANITIHPHLSQTSTANYITNAIRGGNSVEVTPTSLIVHFTSLVDDSSLLERTYDCLISTSESCTIYPTVLHTLKFPSCQLVTFTAVEGQILYENRYHRSVFAQDASHRQRATKSLIDQLVPSHIGAHSGSPLLTIREGQNCLELKFSIQYAGNEVGINLYDVVLGYIEMAWTSKCNHPFSKPMDSLARFSLATSVASPAAALGMGVAMTRWNPTAQFLCCGTGYRALLQRDCCLDCAAEQLGTIDSGVIIVG